MDKLKKHPPLEPERMRQIAWDIGQRYPIPQTGDYVSLSFVHPRLCHAHYHISAESARRHGGGHAVVRVFDVTDIIFNGSNAHSYFDLEVGRHAGGYYFGIERLSRNYLAEAGLRDRDGRFNPLARSNAVHADRDRRSGNYSTSGLFVRRGRKTIPVENIFDAPVYEKLSRVLSGVKRQEALSVAVVFLGLNKEAGFTGPLGSSIKNCSRKLKKFGCKAKLFTTGLAGEQNGKAPVGQPGEHDSRPFAEVEASAEAAYGRLRTALRKEPFHVIHCHDWYSSPVGLALKGSGLLFVLSLHSTEHERSGGDISGELSRQISAIEAMGVRRADMVIVPRDSTRGQVIELYGAPPEKVVVIPDPVEDDPGGASPGPDEVRRWFGLNPEAPIVFFAGEISHASGADLLLEALSTVCRNHHSAQFVFAGEGPLRGELEARAFHQGIGHRCRFIGDVTKDTFDSLLLICDFVVIPARTWQDEGLARAATGAGKPVLATRQSGIGCVNHGENGLITFDNPGSIVWGLQEMLFNPLHGSMLRITARKKAADSPSPEVIAALHYMHYETALQKTGRRG